MSDNKRTLEDGITVDLNDKLTYGDYLGLDRLLSAQSPPSASGHHDEMLFIIQHQVAELWMKLIIHEISASIVHIRHDRIDRCLKILARVKQIQRQLFEQWSVLETLTPTEYVQFRDYLGPSSGFQSLQYRILEFMFGNKHAGMLKVFEHNPEQLERLNEVLRSPSLYDEFLLYLSRHGHRVPRSSLERDFSAAYRYNAELLPVIKNIYDHPDEYWDVYHFCEQLVDVEESFHLWRFRHMKTVERIIGHKRGTGGSSGVDFLKKALELSFFPELIAVRTEIGQDS